MWSPDKFERSEDDDHTNAPKVVAERASIDIPEQRAADGPERDHDIIAPEPTYIPDIDDKEVYVANSTQLKKTKKRWALIVLPVLLCVTALAIGLGVGLSVEKAHNTSTSSPQKSGSPTFTGSSNPTTSSNSSGPTNSPLEHGILNDSSIAAVTQLDLTKHVFFQDINNTIRQAIATGNGDNENWDASLDNIVATDARPSTPMTAFLRLHPWASQYPDEIYLFYVNTNDSLTLINSNGGQWSPATTLMNLSQLDPFSISRQSRSFSGAAIVDSPETGLFDNFGVLLMLHDLEENPLVLYGTETSVKIEGNWTLSIVWQNMTEKFVPQINGTVAEGTRVTNCTFSNLAIQQPPTLYAANINCPKPVTDTNYLTFSFIQLNNTNVTAETLNPQFFQTGATSWGPADASSSHYPSTVLIVPNTTSPTEPGQQLPWNMYYIDNGTLSGEDYSAPSTPFPFTNVAVATPSGVSSTQVFMYHQLNESAFAEETWNYDSGVWSSVIVGVDT